MAANECDNSTVLDGNITALLYRIVDKDRPRGSHIYERHVHWLRLATWRAPVACACSAIAEMNNQQFLAGAATPLTSADHSYAVTSSDRWPIPLPAITAIIGGASFHTYTCIYVVCQQRRQKVQTRPALLSDDTSNR